MKSFSILLLSAILAFTGMLVICASGLNLALICTVWDQPPKDWHIRLFGWDGLLLINLLCTFVVSGILFFVLFWLPRRLDQHVNANGSGGSNPE